MASATVLAPTRERIAEVPTAEYRLTLVLPARNEEAVIVPVLREAQAALAACTTAYEIIVVDDGSTDRTAELVRQEAAQNPHIRLRQQPGLGYGAALRHGFEAAQMDLVAFADSDGQFRLQELARFLPLTDNHDIVCGYRINRQDPALRRFLSWGYNCLIRCLLGTTVRDVDCALKVFRREQLLRILPESPRFFVNSEMLVKARNQEMTVAEIGVTHLPRVAGASKVRFTAIPKTLAELLPFWWSRLLFPAQDQAEPAPAAWRWLGLLVLVCLAALMLYPQLSYPLLEPDEGRYAEIAREMAQTDEWIVPQLHYEPYLDKPPLFYWLVAASFELFGPSPAAARMVPTTATLLTILAIYLLGQRFLGWRRAFVAATLLTLTWGFIQCGRFLIIDSVFTLFLTLALLTGYEAVRTGRLLRGWWLLSASCCALAFLTKGPTACLLVLPPLLAGVCLDRRLSKPAWKAWAGYLGVVLLISLPWFIAMTWRVEGFLHYFVVDQHLARFWKGQYHAKPWWYFLPILFVKGMPWSLLLFPFCRFLGSRKSSTAATRPQAWGYFLLAGLWCLVFFSASKGKLPTYILPAVPMLAIVLGSYLDLALFAAVAQVTFPTVRRTLPWVTVALLCVVGLSVVWKAWTMALAGTQAAVLAGAACFLGIGWAVWWGRKASPAQTWAVCSLLAALLIVNTAQTLVPQWAENHSPATITGRLPELLADKNVAIVCYGREWGSIPFHLNRNDIANFSKREPAQMKTYIAQQDQVLLVVKPTKHATSLKWAVPPGCQIAEIGEHRAARYLLIWRPHGTSSLPQTAPKQSAHTQ
jgi:dolichol-phosphate mannosyltransferase